MRRKYLLSTVLLILVLMTIYILLMNQRIRQSVGEQYTEHYRYEITLIEQIMQVNPEIIKQPQSFIDAVNSEAISHITITDAAGRVLADSLNDTDADGSYLRAPEITKAMTTNEMVFETRYSERYRYTILYVAKRIQIDAATYIIRLSEPLQQIDQLENTNIETGIVIALIASFVAALIAWQISSSFIKPINELIYSTKLITKGQYNNKIYVSSNNEVRELADSFNAMRDNLASTMTDLTARNAELNAILNSMASGIIAVDGVGDILLINQQCYDIFELSSQKVKLHDSIYKAVKNQEIIDMIETVKRDNSFIENEIYHVHTEKRLRVHAHPVTVQNNRTIGTMLVVDDVSKMRKLERMRTDFVSNVTHELKTPLTSILGFVDTLKAGAIENPPKAKRFLTIIETEAERLNRLISDILVLSEIETSQIEKELMLFNFSALIYEVMDILHININEKPLEFQADLDETIIIEANRDRIKQLLINIIDNAIKYTESGYVKICLSAQQNHAKLQIEDSGIGFDEEQKSRLFERFYRIDKARSRKLGGTGLGLSIVKHIVNLYKGEISVESKKGEGTTFLIDLPIVVING